MNEAQKKFLARFSPKEAEQIMEGTEKALSDPEFVRKKALFHRVTEGSATPEDLAEYAEIMRPHDEWEEANRDRKVYDDRG